MKNIFRKSLVVLLIVGILISSLIPNTGFAQGKDLLDSTGCSFSLTIVFECVILAIDYVAYGAVYYVIGWFTGIAGNILSYTLGLTINNAHYAGIEAITAGWQFSRDIVNIFFIFAILFIAIATILGIESYGAKALLARLIIIALLVNFSLLATQAIIYVTNALAYELYGAITVTSDTSILLSANAKPDFNKDISGALMKNLMQQQIFKADPSKIQPGAGVQTNRVVSQLQINIGVLVLILAASAIMLFAAFIFIAGSFFFVVRMVVLWLLMVLAPFGFVFLILPATKGYAQKWWSTLQSQAIFAPAFIFFILLTVRMANSDPTGILAKLNPPGGGAPPTDTTTLVFLLIMQNMIVFMMLGAGLVVAKSMGIYGADASIKMATGAGKAIRGYAGKSALRSAARPARWANAAATGPGRIPYVGPIFRAALKPLTAATSAAVRVTDKEKTEKEEGWKKLSPTALVAAYRATAGPGERRQILKAAAESGKLEKFDQREIRDAYKTFSKKDKSGNRADGKAYTNIVKSHPEFISEDSTLTAPNEKENELRDVMSRMSEKDIEEKLDKNALGDSLVQQAMLVALGEREMAALIRKHGDKAKKAIDDGLTEAVRTVGAPAVYDELMKNNRNLLRGLYRSPGLAAKFGGTGGFREQMESQHPVGGKSLREELNA